MPRAESILGVLHGLAAGVIGFGVEETPGGVAGRFDEVGDHASETGGGDAELITDGVIVHLGNVSGSCGFDEAQQDGPGCVFDLTPRTAAA